MKKVFVCLMMLGIIMLTGCKKDEVDPVKYIQDKGTFVMGMTDFAPMGYKDKDEYYGFDVDVAKEVMKKFGVTLEIKYINWDTKLFQLKSKSVDALWNGCTITEERKEEMTFSRKYLDNNLIILTLKDTTINTLADLADKKVGVESTSSGQIALEKNKPVLDSLKELKKFDKINNALLALNAKTIDAIVVDQIYAQYEVMKKSDNYRIGTEIIGTEEYGIGFRKGETALAAKIDAIIDELVADGTMKQISMKWFDVDIISRG